MKLKNKFFLGQIIFLVFLTSCAWSQSATKKIAPVEAKTMIPQLSDRTYKTSVIVYNNSDQDNSILLGESVESMKAYKLKGKDPWVSPSFNYDPLIKIPSQDTVISYQLDRGNYYVLFWNAKKSYWDVVKNKK